jgi:hypothetical protein
VGKEPSFCWRKFEAASSVSVWASSVLLVPSCTALLIRCIAIGPFRVSKYLRDGFMTSSRGVRGAWTCLAIAMKTITNEQG